jgi:hypothetical protein
MWTNQSEGRKIMTARKSYGPKRVVSGRLKRTLIRRSLTLGVEN